MPAFSFLAATSAGNASQNSAGLGETDLRIKSEHVNTNDLKESWLEQRVQNSIGQTSAKHPQAPGHGQSVLIRGLGGRGWPQ